MSFSRAKITRFNDAEQKSVKQPSQSEIMNKTQSRFQKTEKAPSNLNKNVLTKPSQKPRSLSQPPSNNTVNKQSPRPYSGGDEKTRHLNKTKKGKSTVSGKQSEDEEFDTDVEKSNNDHIYKIEETTDDEKHTDTEESKDPKIHNASSKPSCSGIPLRIRQQASPKPTPVTTPRRSPSLRTTESISARIDHHKTMSPAARRNLETQYQLKKKRVDQLKHEIAERQKLLTDSYRTLVQLNKRLEEVGKGYPLEELKPISTGLSDGKGISGGGENMNKVKIDPNTVQLMKDTIRQIPITLLDMCKSLMNKRQAIVNILEKVSLNSIAGEELQQNIQEIKDETVGLENILDKAFDEQERNVMSLVDTWQELLTSSGSDSASLQENIESLRLTINQKDQQILQKTAEAEELCRQHEEVIANSESAIGELKEKIKTLESELSRDKVTIQESKDKANLYDQRMKLLKTRIRETEGKQKEVESKCVELQKAHRQAQDQLRANEHRWLKEKEEILSKNKHDRQMLDKLTKDRSYFETRMKTLEELVDEKEKKVQDTETKMKNDVEEARKQAIEEKMQRETLQQKYESMKNQLVEMEIRNKQALDLVHTKNEDQGHEDGFATEKEAELYTELLATKVALKAAEDQIQNYNREKLRFIDSIQSLQDDPEKDQEYVAKAMIKNVEKITELEARLAESEETICNQKIEIANFKVEIENLQQFLVDPIDLEKPTADGDLRMMLHEGRMKLEQSLKKTLEYEQKIIRYEHDLNKQSKQICDMENLLKVRDGLIAMMKAKKDELQMENDSLNKYANEIRDLLMQAKEEARNRTELVQELSSNLDSRERTCQQLEKRIKDLEGSVRTTNEKRFKLQESIGAIEQELQTTKAQFSKMGSDTQTRTRLKSHRKW